MELLIPTLNKGSSYHFLLIQLQGTIHEQSEFFKKLTSLPTWIIYFSLSFIYSKLWCLRCVTFFGVKIVLKTSRALEKSQCLNQFLLLDLLLHYWFFNNLQMWNECKFSFHNIAIIRFWLKYSLNITNMLWITKVCCASS